MISRALLLPGLLVCCQAATLPTPRPHPRLQIDQSLLQQIRTLRDEKYPAWTRLERWSRSNPGGNKPAAAVQAIYGRMLVFLVTGDRAQFDIAWNSVRRSIYKNGENRQGGFTNLIDLFKDAHQAAFQGGPFIASIAHFYDWGYGQLNADQRKDLADWIYDAASYTFNDNRSSHSFLRNDGAAATLGLAAAAYATLGDDPRAAQAHRVVSQLLDRDPEGPRHHGEGRRGRRRQCLRILAHGQRHHHHGQPGLLRLGREPFRQPSVVPPAPGVRRFRRVSGNDRRQGRGGPLAGISHRGRGFDRRRRTARRILAQRQPASERPHAVAPIRRHRRGERLELCLSPAGGGSRG